MLAAKFAPATVNRALTALRQVLRFSWRDGLLAWDEYLRLGDVHQVADDGMPRGRALQRREIEALYAACTRDLSPAGRRAACVLALLHAAGLRCAEAAGLTLDAVVDVDSGELLVLGKGGRYAGAGVGRAAPLLQAWLDVRGDRPGPVLYQIRSNGRVVARGIGATAVHEIVAKLAKACGIKATAHDLRRTFATALLRAGYDHLLVQRALRHRDVRSLQCYDRRTDEERARAQRAAIEVPGLS